MTSRTCSPWRENSKPPAAFECGDVVSFLRVLYEGRTHQKMLGGGDRGRNRPILGGVRRLRTAGAEGDVRTARRRDTVELGQWSLANVEGDMYEE